MTDRNLRLAAIVAIAAALLVGSLLMVTWPAQRKLPEVVSAAALCGVTETQATTGSGMLVPDITYDIVQLCPAQPTPGERTQRNGAIHDGAPEKHQ